MEGVPGMRIVVGRVAGEDGRRSRRSFFFWTRIFFLPVGGSGRWGSRSCRQATRPKKWVVEISALQSRRQLQCEPSHLLRPKPQQWPKRTMWLPPLWIFWLRKEDSYQWSPHEIIALLRRTLVTVSSPLIVYARGRVFGPIGCQLPAVC